MVQRLGQILLKARVLTQDVLGDALLRAKQNRVKLGETLISMGAASPEEVLRALAEQNGLPFVTAEELPSAPPVVKNLSPKYLRQYVSCPIAVDGAAVTVATADPANPVLIDDLRQMLGAKVSLCVASAPAILDAIERAYGASTPLQKIVEGMAPGETVEGEEDVNHLRDLAFEAPVVRLVNLLIEEAVASEASDIHVEPFEDRLRVRYRLDGIDAKGKVTLRYLGRLRHITVGARHRNRKVHLLVAGADVRIVTTDGVLLRALTLDPTKDYQALGTGRWPVHDVLRQASTMS